MHESAMKHMSAVELIRHTINNLSALLDLQFVLALLEIKEDIVSVVKGAAILIVGLISLFLMLIALMIAAILALSLVIPGWLAALTVAILFFVVGGILTWIGRGALKIRPLGRTRDTIREDLEWAKHLTSNDKLRS